MRESIRDLIIVVPGIGGSTLEKKGRPIWGYSLDAVSRALLQPRRAIDDLRLIADDPVMENLDDGIVATEVVSLPAIIPRFLRLDGYHAILDHLRSHFHLIPGLFDSQKIGNLFAFPYDWRRDIRFAAKRLASQMELSLVRWRESTGATDSKIILLAHSMGGLVCRYALEVLGAWRHCRALITLGTPHRGSVAALNSLINGTYRGSLDLTDALRTMPSVYQLLPIYKCILFAGTWYRPSELSSLPFGLQNRAAAARILHEEIETSVNQNLKDSHYDANTYLTIPVVGTRQRTLQSATWSDGQLQCAFDAGDNFQDIESHRLQGDGTVPFSSAIPIELSNKYHEWMIPERHSCLVSNNHVLNEISDLISRLQSGSLSTVRSTPTRHLHSTAALSVDVDDLYQDGEPVTIRAQLTEKSATLRGEVTPVDVNVRAVAFSFTNDGGENSWSVTLPGLPSGLYRLTAWVPGSPTAVPSPVHDIFGVGLF